MRLSGLLLLFSFSSNAFAQHKEASELFFQMRKKLEQVQDYIADVRLRIDISFMRIPALNGTLYFKAPDKMRLERQGGISILPKKTLSLSLSNLVPSGNVTIIDAGSEVRNGKKLRIIKVVPEDDGNGIILTKIWVDEETFLALRTETTTRESGTVAMDLQFGEYSELALPDHIVFYVDVKDFKMPKGVTMDYDGGEENVFKKDKSQKTKKGTIRIDYLNYKINTGLKDSVFKE